MNRMKWLVGASLFVLGAPIAAQAQTAGAVTTAGADAAAAGTAHVERPGVKLPIAPVMPASTSEWRKWQTR